MITLNRAITILLIDGIGSTLTRISPYLNTQYISLIVNHRFMNLKNPKTFSEKLSWLKLYRYANDELVRKCADKLLVRDYVVKAGLGHLLNELYAVYKNEKEIEWNKLPDSFVLKWNFGSGYNYLCPNKKIIDKNIVLKNLQDWSKKSFWLFFSELQYNVDEKRILCEKYLNTDGQPLIDYKFYCFHGEVKAILSIERLDSKAERAVFMTPEWEILDDVNHKYNGLLNIPKPNSLEEMKVAAEKLSKPFPFVRVDFYEWNGHPVFGELTFTPASGINPSETLINGKSMGDLLRIIN